MRTTHSTLLASAALALTLPAFAVAQDVDANQLEGETQELELDAQDVDAEGLIDDDMQVADDTQMADDLEVAGGAADQNIDLEAEIVGLDQWNYEDLYTAGISLEELLDADVYGPDGDDIGDVENVLFGSEGEVLSIVAEIGGFLEFGDTHVNIPWDQVEVMEGGGQVMVPITEEQVGDYSLFTEGYGPGGVDNGVVTGDDEVVMGTADEMGSGEVLGDDDAIGAEIAEGTADDLGDEVALGNGDDALLGDEAGSAEELALADDDGGVVEMENVDEIQQVSGDNAGVVETGRGVWRGTDLVGTYARLQDGDSQMNYGYIDDAIIRDGRIAAVVASPDASWGGARGYYAYPYMGGAWTPGVGYYNLPYDRTEVEGMQPFDRELIED